MPPPANLLADTPPPRHPAPLLRGYQIYSLIFTAIFLLHLPLLRLPYFWDEAGYYLPAAHDLYTAGQLIPGSTLDTGHPPLPALYLALWWKLSGRAFTPAATRTAAILLAAFALLQVFYIGRRLTNPAVAAATTICFALYPVFFAQSSMVHADLPACALTLLGLRLYLDSVTPAGAPDHIPRARLLSVVAFSLAVLAKETAVITPLAIFGYEALLLALSSTSAAVRPRLRGLIPLLIPAAVLALWMAFHFWRTGHLFGGPDYMRYNVAGALSVSRIPLALLMRLWHLFGHMNMWVLTLIALAAMLLPPMPLVGAPLWKPKSPGAPAIGSPLRPRIAIHVQALLTAIILAHLLTFSIVGGALLTRYLLPVFPLVMLIFISTLWRRVPRWPLFVTAIALAFAAAIVVNPPYRYAPEDNLAYRDFVILHRHAAAVLAQKYPHSTVLTAWPANDELTRPYLGYTSAPLRVVTINDFSLEQITLARNSGEYDVALFFSSKYEPPRRIRFPGSDALARRFGGHEDLPPALIAQMLGGRIVYSEESRNQWIAIVEFNRVHNAGLRILPPTPYVPRFSRVATTPPAPLPAAVLRLAPSSSPAGTRSAASAP